MCTETRSNADDWASPGSESSVAVDFEFVRNDDCADGAEIAVSPVLSSVLKNVVENAVEHNDAADPLVGVRATCVDEAVEIRVADNGPGISDHERAALERGNETPLEHGSGLGLWLIAWGTEMADGDLTIDDREGGGTVVTVRVPRVVPEE